MLLVVGVGHGMWAAAPQLVKAPGVLANWLQTLATQNAPRLGGLQAFQAFLDAETIALIVWTITGAFVWRSLGQKMGHKGPRAVNVAAELLLSLPLLKERTKG